ncbi:hypothetical protein ACSSS7_005167 [Eimeria intestinalis]
MDPEGGMDLASAPPLPDGGPPPPAARRGVPALEGPRRGGGGRGRGFRRGPPHGGGPPRVMPPRSPSMVRWQNLRRQIVTIGDDVCLVPTQLISLSQLVSDCIVAEREERQGAPHSLGVDTTHREGGPPKQQEGGPSTTGQNGVQQEQGQPGETPAADSSIEAPAAAPAAPAAAAVAVAGGGEEEVVVGSSKGNKGATNELEAKVIDLIVECAARLPIKSGIYAALVGLLYRKARLRGWVSSLVLAASARFEKCLGHGHFTDAKLLLRFFLGLASSHVLALSALPWLSVRMYESDHASLVDALDCPDTKPDADTLLLLSAVQPFTGPLAAAAGAFEGGGPEAPGGPSDVGWGPQDPAEPNAIPSLKPTDRLASLLDAIDAMIDRLRLRGFKAEWHSRATLRFYQSSELQPLLSGEGPGAPPLIELPTLALGAPQLRQLRVPPLEPVLRIPATLEHVDVPLQPHDRCEMLRMPRSPVIRGPSGAPFAYGRLLQRLCQLQNSVGNVVEVLLSSLVRRAYDLDHEALLVLSDFFGYWLNAWGGPSKLLDEWLGVAKAPPSTKLFVRLSLEKAMRINYPDALALSIPNCAKELWPPRAVADNPYLCLTPAPPPAANGGAQQQGAPSAPPQEASGGVGAPLGLIEFSLLRQQLKFSFGSQDAKEASVLRVHRLLSSLVGQHKSKSTRPSQGAPQQVETQEAQGRGGPSNDSDAAVRPQKETDAEGVMDTDVPATEGLSAEAATDATDKTSAPAAAAAAEPEKAPGAGTAAAEAVGVAGAAEEEVAIGRREEEMEEEEEEENDDDEAGAEVIAPSAQGIDWGPLEESERALDSPPWDVAELVRMFVYCLLALGSKTQTHLHRLLSNYAPVFRLLEKEGSQGDESVISDQQVDIHPPALQALQKYWANSQQK